MTEHSARVVAHLAVLYPDRDDLEDLAVRLLVAVGTPDPSASRGERRWGPDDAVLITYADSVRDDGRPPLQVLYDLVAAELATSFSTLHLLPFFPSTSDHGFSIVDHDAVDPAFGTWDDVDKLASAVDVMVDLVCNHRSAGSPRFAELMADVAPGRDWFMTADPDTDVSAVVRPRSQPLLYPADTVAGRRWVWCTFGPDQIDLDLTNPDVLVDLTATLGKLVAHGARFVRLDAVAFLWKEIGTPCIHLERTHETVRLWRTLLDVAAPGTSIVTETNVPNRENVSYFGDGNEANIVYNFPLPPLVVHALTSGNAEHLGAWLQQLTPPPPGCTFLNFLASHDGIGLRPAEGILSPDEIDSLVDLCLERGGRHGTYDTPSGSRPYELNTSLWDLLDSPGDSLAAERYLCAHAIMLGVVGIPALWMNALFARPNDPAAAERTGVRREISRTPMTLAASLDHLGDRTSGRGLATAAILRLLRIRAAQPAFDPAATQRILDLGTSLLGLGRLSNDHSQEILAVHNCTTKARALDLAALDLGGPGRSGGPPWFDLIAEEDVSIERALTVAPYQSRWITNCRPTPPPR